MEQYLQTIKQRGYKLTEPRKKLLHELCFAKNPFSANALYLRLKKEIDLVSIYRTLALFEKLNIVTKEIFNNEAHYHLGNHHHITCTHCGAIECVPCEHQPPRIKHFINITHQFVLKGICDSCAKG